MSYPIIDNNVNSGHQTVKHPNVNVKLRTPTKHNHDAVKVAEEQKKQNDMVAEYNQICNDNDMNLLQQQNQIISKISSTTLANLSQITGKAQETSNALKGASQQIKQRIDSNLTQQQQKQQQEQQKQQQQF